MFKKIKFLFASAIMAIGVTGCSSDNDSNFGPGPDSNSNPGGTYTLSVNVTEGASIEHVLAVFGDATGSMDTDMVREINATNWSKEYTIKRGQKASFTAQGFGKDDGSSKLTLKLTQGNKVVKEASGSGSILQAIISI